MAPRYVARVQPGSGGLKREYRNSIRGELDTHTVTDARSAKKDVISTKPQKAMGAVRYSPEKDKEKHKPNLLPSYPCHMSPFSGHAILCKQGRQGRGAIPLV